MLPVPGFFENPFSLLKIHPIHSIWVDGNGCAAGSALFPYAFTRHSFCINASIMPDF
jgi:hypothetical protein